MTCSLDDVTKTPRAASPATHTTRLLPLAARCRRTGERVGCREYR
jgi:hypothetical protein